MMGKDEEEPIQKHKGTMVLRDQRASLCRIVRCTAGRGTDFRNYGWVYALESYGKAHGI